MLRSIVGWVLVGNGDWHHAMSRMNHQVENAYGICPTNSCFERIRRRTFCLAAYFAGKENHDT